MLLYYIEIENGNVIYKRSGPHSSQNNENSVGIRKELNAMKKSFNETLRVTVKGNVFALLSTLGKVYRMLCCDNVGDNLLDGAYAPSIITGR